jgi:hypothetical protein
MTVHPGSLEGERVFSCNRYNDVARFPRPIPGFTPASPLADAMLFKQIGMGQMNSQTT